MRPTALLADCYGTLVHGDRAVIEAVVADVAARTGLDPAQLDRPWWQRFSQLCSGASGENFRSQFELEAASLSYVLRRLGAPLGAAEVEESLVPLVDYWRTAEPYADAVELLGNWPSGRVAIVSNIDRADIEHLARGLPRVAAIVTSEDARAYKPDPAVFRRALEAVGATALDAVHVGDSYESDVVGARAAGIRAVRIVRDGVPAHGEIASLADLPAWVEGLAR